MRLKVIEVHDYFVNTEIIDFTWTTVSGSTVRSSIKGDVKAGDILEYNPETLQYEKVPL
jgi:hypothetical protein